MASAVRRAVNKKVTRALREFSMLSAGDKVLVALSGGKDSLCLLHELHGRQGKAEVPFELLAVHVRSDFVDAAASEFLMSHCAELQVPLRVLNVPVLARLKPGKEMNCYWCSMQRRTELIDLARKEGCSKLALGHHMDDVLETLLMNLLYQGKFEGMNPALVYDKYPLTILRPLVYCEEREIVAYIRELGLLSYTCQCGYSGERSLRRRMRRHISELTDGNFTLKANMLAAVRSGVAGW